MCDCLESGRGHIANASKSEGQCSGLTYIYYNYGTSGLLLENGAHTRYDLRFRLASHANELLSHWYEDRSSLAPSGSYLQVATTYARMPAKQWKCTRQVAGKPAEQAEPEPDWYGQGAKRAEWRNQAIVIMTARLTDCLLYTSDAADDTPC
eukprot:5180584-Pyramimonas_sp.AAC.1